MSLRTEKLGKLLAPSGYDRAGSTDYPLLSITMHEGLVDQSAKFKKRVASRDTASYRVVYTNELVVGFPIDEGVLGFQTKYPAGIVSPAYGVWKLTLPEETHVPYLEGYLRSSIARVVYASKMRGGVARRRTISKEEFLDIDIPFPPFEEQKRIATVLDKADALRKQRQESLQLSEKLIRSVFIDMFGDPATNPKGWELTELSALGTLDRGVSKHRPRNAPELLGGKYPLIQTGDVSNAGLYIRDFTSTYSETGFKQSRLWPKGTLCITIAANIAKTGILAFDACFPDSVVGFTPHKGVSSSVYVHFLFGFLQAMLEKNAPQAAQKNINLAILRTLRVPSPPVSLQEKFERFVSQTTILSNNQKDSLALAGRAFASIQQRAFRGELDLSRLFLEKDVEAIERAVDRLHRVVHETLPKTLGTKHANRAFVAPPETELTLKLQDSTVQEGSPIPWSADYFRYRILAAQSAPFSFADLMQKAEAIFEEPPPYETIRDLIFDLLGQDGKPAYLRQRFDLQTNEATNEVTGRKEIVFEPAP